MKKGDHLFLVDGSAYIFRAYHALPPLTRKTDGMPVGAVAGFCNMLWKLLQDARDTERGVTPTHFAVIFDHSSKTFRNDLYADYKANRDAPPEDLRPQFGLIREATRAFGVPCIETEGYEADDIIATYARLAAEQGADVTIVSSDKDLMQLINDQVVMYDQMKDLVIDANGVFDKFGVTPDKMIDLQALNGDTSDNIPGVPGIGPKTASQLLDDFGTLEELLERAGEIKQNKRRENLIEFADQARLSKQLVTLDQNTPIDVALEDMALEPVQGPELIAFLKAMTFSTLTRRVAEATSTDADAVEADEVAEPKGADLRGPDSEGDEVASANEWTPAALAKQRAEAHAAAKFDHDRYEIVRDVARLREIAERAVDQGFWAFDLETSSLDAMVAEIAGIAIALDDNEAFYVPIAHKAGEGDLLSNETRADNQIEPREALPILKRALENPALLTIGLNLKYDMLVLAQEGISVAAPDDVMLMSYALDAGRTNHGMDALSDRHLGHQPLPIKDLIRTGKKAITFDFVEIEKAATYAAEDADVTLRLWRVLKPRLAAEQMANVYERLERPLVDVIVKMEQRGIQVDRQILSRLSGDMAQKAAGIEDEIYELAGRKFNAGSPKQLGEILFDEMGLPGGKKTKTGAWQTGAQVLEDLAAEGHELPRRIVDWRQLTKLKSTYTDALPTYMNAKTGRVHTSYSMAATTTGRLSSSEPNLQNIPVRTEAGRKIRTAFVAPEGHKLVSADYSQIELRLLAHIADIPQLTQAFADGVDIHAMTASEMFGVPVEGMDPMIRRQAKAINFGIIYGISAFGLANNLGIGRQEAGDYIKTYFERFPGIRDYMDETKAFARDHGYVETIFGRRAHYPEIRSANGAMRAFNERAAINAPIQGSAADIIRRAMIRMDAALEYAKLQAKMLLQVHDELIFEVPDAEVDDTITLVRKVMETATDPVMQLKVPLVAEAQAATNWDEAH
ncbi:MAG: DNA polymerase I [Pseudomonadota bacterium]